MLIVLGLDRRRGGGGPTLFTYNKRTGETRNAGPLFSADSPYSWSLAEGWYFSATRPTALYVNEGGRMLRYDVQQHTFETVFDVRDWFGSDKFIWQMHSSADDRVHSATLRQDGSYEMLGCVVYDEAVGRPAFYAKKGDFDECQVDRSGRWNASWNVRRRMPSFARDWPNTGRRTRSRDASNWSFRTIQIGTSRNCRASVVNWAALSTGTTGRLENRPAISVRQRRPRRERNRSRSTTST
jgi:hypothetical protein